MPSVVIDTATVYYRAFYALPESLTAPDGHPHNAVRGTLGTFRSLAERFATTQLVPTWDLDWRPQWRVDLVPDYKTHRLMTAEEAEEDIPDTLGPQIGAIFDLLTAVGLSPLGAEDHEADDVIGTLAAQATEPMLIVSNDKDLMQCVDDRRNVRYLLMSPGGMDRWHIFDEQGVRERFGVTPAQYVDFAVLRGDASDGLPGVPGVGEKTACALITAFGSLDAVIAAAQSDAIVKPLTPRIASRIDPLALDAARQVTTAVTTLPVTHPSPWNPDRVDAATLGVTAADWGVETSVEQLLDSLHRLHDAAA